MDTVLKRMENRLVSTEQKNHAKEARKEDREAAAKKQLNLDTFSKT